MTEIKRMTKQTGGAMFEFRDAPLLRSLASKKKQWPFFIETPLGFYDPHYRIDLKEGGGTQKDRLNMVGTVDPFNLQIAKIVGLTDTEFPSTVLSVKVELTTDQEVSHLIARMIAVETNDGWVEFEIPFERNCLTFTESFKSKLWIFHLKHLRQRDPFIFLQAAKKIDSFCRKVRDYSEGEKNLVGQERKAFAQSLENNILLLSPYWEWMGIDLGLHVTTFPDQPQARISMTGHGRIERGIELKYGSKGYTTSHYKSRPSGREMIILCFEHNDKKLLNGEDYLDVVDASELGRFMMGELSKLDIVQEEI